METTEDYFELYFSSTIRDTIMNITNECEFNNNYLINLNNNIEFYDFLKMNINIDLSVNLYEEGYIKDINEEYESDDEYL